VLFVASTTLVSVRTSSDPPPGPVESPDAQEVIPAEFDLADGLPRELVSFGTQAPPVEICGKHVKVPQIATGSQSAGSSPGPDLFTRLLSVYPDADTARRAASNLVATFEDCQDYTHREGTGWSTTVETTSLGDQGWVLVRSVDDPGPRSHFVDVIQVVRLGASVLVLEQREGHGITVADGRRGTSDQVTWLLRRQMCLFTENGCAWRSDPDVLRPDGWALWRLGMSREDLEATGGVEFSDVGECTGVDLGPGAGSLSQVDGLVSIRVPESITTPDGIGAGSDLEEVLKMYPYAEKSGDVVLVRASPTTDYELTLERGLVGQLTLLTVGEECSG
jgi:hypothetical protein